MCARMCVHVHGYYITRYCQRKREKRRNGQEKERGGSNQQASKVDFGVRKIIRYNTQTDR